MPAKRKSNPDSPRPNSAPEGSATALSRLTTISVPSSPQIRPRPAPVPLDPVPLVSLGDFLLERHEYDEDRVMPLFSRGGGTTPIMMDDQRHRQWHRESTEFLFIDGIFVSRQLLARGIMYILPGDIDPARLKTEEAKLSTGSFVFGSRELDIGNGKFSEKYLPFIRHMYPTVTVSDKFMQGTWPKLSRKEDCIDKHFYPLLIQIPEKKAVAAVYANLSILGERKACKAWNSQSFNGFSTFVTAMCMFGSNLKGMNQYGNFRPLMKHYLPFFEGEQIQSIKVSLDTNVYEMLCFNEFRTHLRLVKNLARTKLGVLPHVICHIPWVDYILFSVELYLKGKLTLPALGQLVAHVMIKRDGYYATIKDIAEHYGVNVETFSPLENLFDPTVLASLKEEQDYTRIAHTILEVFGVMEGGKVVLESNQFMSHCLHRVANNRFHAPTQPLWATYKDMIERNIKLERDQKAKPGQLAEESIEELLQVANTMMIAYARAYRDPKDLFAVCSLLSESEVPIQRAFSRLFPQSPPVAALAIIDPVIALKTAANPTGTLFYSEDFPLEKLANLLQNEGGDGNVNVNESRWTLACTILEQLGVPPGEKVEGSVDSAAKKPQNLDSHALRKYVKLLRQGGWRALPDTLTEESKTRIHACYRKKYLEAPPVQPIPSDVTLPDFPPLLPSYPSEPLSTTPAPSSEQSLQGSSGLIVHPEIRPT